MVKIIELVDNDYYSRRNDHVVLPDGMDIEEQKKAYRRWSWHDRREDEPPMSFYDWLRRRGAREPTDDEFGTFEE